MSVRRRIHAGKFNYKEFGLIVIDSLKQDPAAHIDGTNMNDYATR
jgi:hypothetical protein